uniref:sodium/iodide cotransporter-like n=1 Tax=Styela clava TaxID=7725 RepID=UPI0019397516|nr:sodium/iodide cotransporter-like [Styela clava]
MADTENENDISLKAADYAVFGVMLGISAIVGIYFAIKDRNAKGDVENYLLGERKISWLASGFSSSLSFLSAVSVLGIPAEMMYYGGGYCMLILSILLCNAISAEMILPIYYKLGLSSAYEGGLKAVIWTDVLQGTILLIVLLIVLFMSAEDAGGFDNVWQICRDGDRLDFFQFDFDPRYRFTFWSIVFGLGIMWTSISCTNQAVSQRFLCCRSVNAGKMAMYSSWIFGLFMLIPLYIIGFIAYAYFGDCDPLLSNKISAGDQVLPYMVMIVFRDLPGMSGLFIAGIFAAGLSTISSALNGMSCVTVGDLIQPHFNWSKNTLLWVSKGLTLTYGIICIAFAYLSSILGGLIQATLSLLGICAGPLLGPVVLGTLVPFTNSAGAISGMLISLAFNIWLYVGSTIYPPPPEFMRAKYITASGCPVSNSTQNFTTIPSTSSSTFLATDTDQTLAGPEERPAIADFYAVSFALYALYGLMVNLLVGLIVSCASGGLKSRHHVNPNHIYLPFEHKLLRWLPEKFRRIMRPKFVTTENAISSKQEQNLTDVNGSGYLENGKISDKSDGKQNFGFINDETISTIM